MAETTFGAIDLYTGESYEDRPIINDDNSGRPEAAKFFPNSLRDDDPDGLYKDRCKKLIKFAAYYSACALIFILEKVNDEIGENNCDGRVNEKLNLVGDVNKYVGLAPHSVAQPIDIIQMHQDFICTSL